MRVTQKVRKTRDWYEDDPLNVKANLALTVFSGNA
jgi:hypothetical protein